MSPTSRSQPMRSCCRNDLWTTGQRLPSRGIRTQTCKLRGQRGTPPAVKFCCCKRRTWSSRTPACRRVHFGIRLAMTSKRWTRYRNVRFTSCLQAGVSSRVVQLVFQAVPVTVFMRVHPCLTIPQGPPLDRGSMAQWGQPTNPSDQWAQAQQQQQGYVPQYGAPGYQPAATYVYPPAGGVAQPALPAQPAFYGNLVQPQPVAAVVAPPANPTYGHPVPAPAYANAGAPAVNYPNLAAPAEVSPYFMHALCVSFNIHRSTSVVACVYPFEERCLTPPCAAGV